MRHTDFVQARTLEDVLDAEYIPRRLNLKPSSAEQMRYSIRSFSRHLGHEACLHDLTEMPVLRWLHKRKIEKSLSTAKRERGDILCLWTFAHKRGLYSVPPADIEPIKVQPKIPRAMSVDDVSGILRVTTRLRGTMRGLPILRSDWYSSLVLFLYDTGSRITASLDVPPRDIDLDAGLAMLVAQHSKTGIEQLVNLSEQTVQFISRIYDPARANVWPYPWHKRRLWLDLHELCHAAGVTLLKGEGFHVLRKTHATMAVKAHGWARSQADLGHTNEQMTRRYVDPRLLGPRGLSLPRPEVG